MSDRVSGQGMESRVQVTRNLTTDGIRDPGEVTVVRLGDKLSSLLVLMGYDNAHIYNAIIKLLVQGKVRIDYRNRTERLELVNQGNRLNRTEAIALVDTWVSRLREQAMGQDPGTERIVL